MLIPCADPAIDYFEPEGTHLTRGNLAYMVGGGEPVSGIYSFLGKDGSVYELLLVGDPEIEVKAAQPLRSAFKMDAATASIRCEPVDIANKSFTVECWAKRGTPTNGYRQIIFSQDAAGNGRDAPVNHGFLMGFRGDCRFFCDFVSNALDAGSPGSR